VTFRCADCLRTFDATPSRHEDAFEHPHPFSYFADCPICGEECSQVPWQKGLFNAHLKATGPKTPEGKRIAAKNLDHHSTKLSRFNALKHGATAKTAMFFPARPGKYPHCKTCDVDHDYCEQQPACIKRTELTMKHLVAIQTGDPEHLKAMHAVQQANLAALFDDMLQSIISDGVALKNPAYGFDKEGNCSIATFTNSNTGERETIEEVKAHPLLKPLFELLSKNNLSLADLNMTQKVQVDQGIQQGRLAADEEEKENAEAYRQKMTSQLTGLKKLISRSQSRLNHDPVLIEHAQEEASDTQKKPELIEAKVNSGSNTN